LENEEKENKNKKKHNKKLKKELKKSRKKQKKEKREKLREEELKKIFESYGIQNINEKGPNIVYLEEKKREKVQEDEY